MQYIDIHFLVQIIEVLNMADDVINNDMKLSKFQRDWFTNEVADIHSQCKARLNV